MIGYGFVQHLVLSCYLYLPPIVLLLARMVHFYYPVLLLLFLLHMVFISAASSLALRTFLDP